METITIKFSDIVKMRRFEGSLNFVNVTPLVNDDQMTIEIKASEIPQHLIIEVSFQSAKLTFTKD